MAYYQFNEESGQIAFDSSTASGHDGTLGTSAGVDSADPLWVVSGPPSNQAPQVDAGADQSVDEGVTVSLDPASFTDAGTADTHTASIHWGDGTAADAGVVAESPSGPPGSTTPAAGTVNNPKPAESFSTQLFEASGQHHGKRTRSSSVTS